LFAGGSAPPPPATWCGADPTPDSLPCEVTQPCRGGPIIVRGEAIPGNAFFFCLDRSVSMRGTWQGKVKLQHAKEWIIEAIDALTDDMEFSLLAFDAGMMIYSEDPIRATDREKERAIAWIMGATAGNGSCLAPAGVRTLSIANRSLLPWHRIFIVTDGTPVCNGVNTQELCLTHITEANVSKSPIDTVFVPDDGGDHDPEFLHELAARNGGEFRTVAP
ncbi:MAG: hypothetical protein JXP34_24240, partial [Planctomycetes bacterium]|nr:hypothetical protein [Planctomycetota bacterium]